MKKNVAIFGANGQIGHELYKTLEGSYALRPLPVRSNSVDFRKPYQIKDFLRNNNLGYVVNAAAYTNVDGAETDIETCFLVNELGPYFIAQECHVLGIPLIHISTDYVFDGCKSAPYEETDEPNPKGIYAVSKYLAERHIQRILKRHIILRTSWVYSDRQKNFVRTMLHLARTHSEYLRIVSDQTGCPTPASYVAEAIKMIILDMELTDGLMEDAKYGIYHYCGLEPTTWEYFAKKIFEAAKLDIVVAPITTEEYGAAAPRPKNSVLNCSKIKNIFNVRQMSWQETLPEVVASI